MYYTRKLYNLLYFSEPYRTIRIGNGYLHYNQDSIIRLRSYLQTLIISLFIRRACKTVQ